MSVDFVQNGQSTFSFMVAIVGLSFSCGTFGPADKAGGIESFSQIAISAMPLLRGWMKNAGSNTLYKQVRVARMRRVRRVVKRVRKEERGEREGPVSFKQRGVAYKTVNESTAGWSSPRLRLNNVEARERAWRGP